MKVLILQFLKGKDTSELVSLAKIPQITILRGKQSEKFSFQMNEQELQQAYDMHTKNLLTAVEAARTGEYGMIVLDEVMGTLSCNLIDEDLLKNFVETKPESLELVMTGRNPPEWLVEKADYVSEIMKRKHPFDDGIPARKGIEM